MVQANGKVLNESKSSGEKKLSARHARSQMSDSYITAKPNETMGNVSKRFDAGGLSSCTLIGVDLN